MIDFTEMNKINYFLILKLSLDNHIGAKIAFPSLHLLENHKKRKKYWFELKRTFGILKLRTMLKLNHKADKLAKDATKSNISEHLHPNTIHFSHHTLLVNNFLPTNISFLTTRQKLTPSKANNKKTYEEGQEILDILPSKFILKYLQDSAYFDFVWKLLHNKLPIRDKECNHCKTKMDSTHFLKCSQHGNNNANLKEFFKIPTGNRIQKQKGYEKLIESIKELNEQYHNFKRLPIPQN